MAKRIDVAGQPRTTRRSFLGASAATIGGGLTACRRGHAEDQVNEQFVMCVDVPVLGRARIRDEYPPVQQAIDFDRGGPAPARAMSAMRSPATIANAPRLPSQATPSGPARIAAINRWNDKILRIAFVDDISKTFRDQVVQIARTWSDWADIEFDVTNRSDAHIRVGFETDSRKPDSGHWSYVGTDWQTLGVRGKTMNLAITEASLRSNPYHRAVVLHEFGHALGCIHEHQSPGSGGIRFDSAKTIAYFKRVYGWSKQMVQENVLRRYGADDLLRFTDFDRDSIMLYQYPGEITIDGVETNQNHVLSRTDMEFMVYLYPGKRTIEDLPPVEDDKKVDARIRRLEIGERTGGAIQVDKTDAYVFTVKSTGAYTVRSEGYTQVTFVLNAKSESADLVDSKTLVTPDLVNLEATTAHLEPGEYRLDVRHRRAGGAGEYGILVLEGDQRTPGAVAASLP